MLLISGKRRWLKLFLFITVPAFILLYLQDPNALKSRIIPLRKHAITEATYKILDGKTENGSYGFIPMPEASDYCRAHEFDVYAHRESRRKVYDLFMVNTELDWLEIRLNTLKDSVDYFVIVEGNITFTGIPKQLSVKENWNLFKPFHDKMIHHVVDDSMIDSNITWDHEDGTRNSMFDQVFFDLKGVQKPEQGDVILVSDIDEIPRAETVTVLRNCKFPRRLTLRSKFYYYGFQWLHHGEEWPHPQATYYEGEKTIRPADLRNSAESLLKGPLDKADLWNAAWHCSSCFKTIEEMINKMHSFSHTKWDLPEFQRRSGIVHRVRNGLDLFDREGETYDRVENNEDVPSYIKQDPDRFDYLLDRDPINANFQDYGLEEAEADIIQDKSLGKGDWHADEGRV